jgi:hypothetical protein
MSLYLPDASQAYYAKFGRHIESHFIKWACYNGYPEKLALVLMRAIDVGAPLTPKDVIEQLEALDYNAALRAGAASDDPT